MKKIKVDEKYRGLMEVWIEDLRLHPELQGPEYLYNGAKDTFCCLGRLCVVAGADPENIKYNELIFQGTADIPEVFISRDKDGSDITRPEADDVPSLLAEMNDSSMSGVREMIRKTWDLPDQVHYNFKDIADFLEQRLEYYED